PRLLQSTRPPSTAQVCRPDSGLHPGRVFPGIGADIQAGIDPVAFTGADLARGRNTFTGADRAAHSYVALRPDAPAGIEMRATGDRPAGLDSVAGANGFAALDRATHPKALPAPDRTGDQQVLGDAPAAVDSHRA